MQILNKFVEVDAEESEQMGASGHGFDRIESIEIGLVRVEVQEHLTIVQYYLRLLQTQLKSGKVAAEPA